MGKAVFTWGLVGLAVLVAGCATTGGGKSPEEVIRGELEGWSTAFVAQDLPTVMTFYSEDFNHFEYGDKAGLQDYLQGVIDSGYMDGATVDMAETVVTVDGETATAGPIGLQASFGAAIINLTLAQEAEGWKIVKMDVSLQ